MKKAIIVRVRSRYESVWHASEFWYKLIGLLGDEGLKQRLADMEGMPLMPQLALPYIAALGKDIAKKHNMDLEFYFADEYYENLRDLLKKGKYDLVLFTVNSSSAMESYMLSEELMKMGVQTVMGGIHPSMLPHEAMKHATSVATGEAEVVLERVLKDFYAGELKPFYRGGRARDMNNHVIPDWNASVTGNYAPELLPIETSRGCKNACEFCSTTRFQGPKRRHRPIEDVVEEIQYLRKTGVLTHQTIFFTDNNIVSDTDYRRGIWDTEYARKLFEALIPLEITWVGQAELDVGDDLELTKLMARSGCETLLVGIESLEEEGLESLGKGCNVVDRYENQIGTLHECGIAVSGSFIVGVDNEKGPEAYDRLLDFIDKYIEIPTINILTPYPGTKLFRVYEKANRILHKEWSFYDTKHVVFKPKHMEPEEFEEYIKDLLEKVFSPARMLQRSFRHGMRNPLPGTTRLSKVDRITGTLSGNIGYKLIHQDCCEPSAKWFSHNSRPRINPVWKIKQKVKKFIPIPLTI